MNRFLHRFLGCAAAFWLTAALVSCSPEENVPTESTAASADTTISASPAESQTEAPAALPLTLQKSCSHPASHTVYPGESITYTYTLTSTGDAPITASLTDTLPANAEYVGGADKADGTALSWNVELSAGKSASYTCTVRVKNDASLGGVIQGTEASVGGVRADCYDLYIEQTLNAVDQPYITTAIRALSDSTYSGITLAKWIYAVAYTNSAELGTTVTDKALADIKSGGKAAILDLVAPTLYGGKSITAAIDGVKGAPCAEVTEKDLIIGDVILADSAVYMYGGDGLYALEGGAVKKDIAAVLKALPQSEKFAVLRPSVGMKDFTPSDPAEKPLTLNDKQKAIIATAEAYLLRGEKLQYDDTRFSAQSGTEYRWQVGLNAPEDAASSEWQYTNCAAFTHDVYWQVLGEKLPSNMYTTNSLVVNSDRYNMRMYYYSRAADSVQSAEEKAKVHKEFTEALVPGDIMVILRGTYGHAMLYIGNGHFIHSTGSSYSYTTSTGIEAYEPSIRYNRIEDYFFNENSKGYVFGPVTDLAIVRPLEYFKGDVTENTKNRVANMQGIMAEKTASRSSAQTVSPGEELSFTYTIFNTNDKAVKLDIADTVPAGTTYVSGDFKVSGRGLSLSVDIPAGERIRVSYTVKVNADTPFGTKIRTEDSTVGGVRVLCPAVQVRRTLNAAEQQAIVDAVKALRAEGTKLAGLELANEIYRRALGVENIFADTSFAAVTAGEEGCFQLYTVNGAAQQTGGKNVYTTNPDGKYADLVAPTLYGGYRLYTAPFTFDRVRLPQEHNLIIGDVIFGKTSSSDNLVIYIGEEYGISLKAGMGNDSADILVRLERLHGYAYYFAIMRPSFALEK